MFNFLRVVYPYGSNPRGFWTKDGEKIPGSEFEGPEEANDAELTICVVWTKDGKRTGRPELPPQGANDVTLDLTGGEGKGKRPKRELEPKSY